MSLSANPIIFNLSARRCSHCRRTGHSVTNCRRAQLDGFVIHQNILYSIQREEGRNNRDSIKLILSNYTFHQLKILMRILHIVGPGATFIHTLYNYRIITIQNSLLRLKEDHIIVLVYYYLHHPPIQSTPLQPLVLAVEPNKFNIHSFSQELLEESESNLFDCPICMESKERQEKVLFNCNHEFCKTCTDLYLNHCLENTNSSFIKPCCSLCRATITSVIFYKKEFKEELSQKYFV